MKSNGRLFLISALLALVTSFALIYFIRIHSTATTKASPQIEVVVAAKEIPERVMITSDMVKLQPMDEADVHPKSIRRLEDVAGTISRQQISSGEAILSDKIARLDGQSLFAIKIPKGQRAMSIAYNDVLGVGGFLIPGDRVDVILTFSKDALHGKNDLSKITMQNIQVLAVGQQNRAEEVTGTVNNKQEKDKDKKDSTKSEQATKSATITLSVTPEQAEQLGFAESFGSIKLALRGPLDKEIPNTPGTTNDSAAAVR